MSHLSQPLECWDYSLHHHAGCLLYFSTDYFSIKVYLLFNYQTHLLCFRLSMQGHELSKFLTSKNILRLCKMCFDLRPMSFQSRSQAGEYLPTDAIFIYLVTSFTSHPGLSWCMGHLESQCNTLTDAWGQQPGCCLSRARGDWPT